MLTVYTRVYANDPQQSYSIRLAVGFWSVLVSLVALLWTGSAWAIQIAVISDLNGSYGSVKYHPAVDQAVQRIVQLNPDLVISTGDMVAGQRISSLFARSEVEDMWQVFHEKVTNPLQAAGIDFVVTPGNHDGSAYPRYHLERQIYAEQWGDKKPALPFLDDSHYPFYYALSINNNLLISLDVTVPGVLKAEQKMWLEGLLKSHGDHYIRKIIFSHLPLWPFSQDRTTEAMMDSGLETILKNHSVDIYLSGHHHAYYPGYKDGVRYVSQACLGAAPRKLIGDVRNSDRSITILDIDKNGDIQVNAYRAPGYVDPVLLETLPERIVSPKATLLREDIGLRSEHVKIQ